MSDKDAGGMYRTVRYPRRFVWTGDVPQGEYIEQLGPNEKCVCVAKGKDYDGVSWDAEAAENHTASESWTETFDHHPQYEPEKVAFSEVDRLRAENETLLKRNETLQALLTEERERHAKVQELQQELQAAYNSKGLHLSDPLSDCVRELRTQLTQAWMRLDYATADRIAVLIGDPKPSDHEREDLQPEPDAEWPEVWEMTAEIGRAHV